MTQDSVLEEYLRDIEFDETRIKNRFFTEMLNDILQSKIDIENAMNDMNDACDDLKDTSEEFDSSAREMCDAAGEFYDAVNNDLVGGINDLADGAEELCSNSADLNNGAGDIFDLFLNNAESSLAQYGINRDLTHDNYASVLSSVSFADSGNKYAQNIDTLLSSLRQVDEYCSGVRTYTSAVGEASSGAADLRAASEQIKGASQQFVYGLGQYAQAPEFGGALDSLKSSYDMINSGIAGADEGNGNFYLILASLFVGMPISKLFVDKVWFAVSNQNIEAGYDTHYPIFFYIIITGVVIAMYFIITFILNSVINKIHMSEVLKNRE